MNTNDLLQSTYGQILEVISQKTSPEADDLTIDAASFSGLNAALNTNGLYYYQLRARQLGGEMQILITDREGSALAESLSPYNCTAAVIQIAGNLADSQATPPTIGFNADVQSFYDVQANGTTTFNGGYFISIITLEVKKLMTPDAEIILGEVYFSVVAKSGAYDTADVIVTMINPIPKQ
jgi:hypothetical protein